MAISVGIQNSCGKGSRKLKKDQGGFAINGRERPTNPFHVSSIINARDRRGHQENQELTLDFASRGTRVPGIHGMLD